MHSPYFLCDRCWRRWASRPTPTRLCYWLKHFASTMGSSSWTTRTTSSNWKNSNWKGLRAKQRNHQREGQQRISLKYSSWTWSPRSWKPPNWSSSWAALVTSLASSGTYSAFLKTMMGASSLSFSSRRIVTRGRSLPWVTSCLPPYPPLALETIIRKQILKGRSDPWSCSLGCWPLQLWWTTWTRC